MMNNTGKKGNERWESIVHARRTGCSWEAACAVSPDRYGNAPLSAWE
jgi:hypothetical protein